MVYRALADVVVVVHLGYLVFVVIGAPLAWRWPRLLWLHVPAVAWSASLVTFGLDCPLTPIERDLRERAGEGAYAESFVERYLEGIVYPGEHTDTARALVALVIAVGYAGLVIGWTRRRRARPDGRERVAAASRS